MQPRVPGGCVTGSLRKQVLKFHGAGSGSGGLLRHQGWKPSPGISLVQSCAGPGTGKSYGFWSGIERCHKSIGGRIRVSAMGMLEICSAHGDPVQASSTAVDAIGTAAIGEAD